MTKRIRNEFMNIYYGSIRLDEEPIYANLLTKYLPRHAKNVIRANFLGSSHIIEPAVKNIIRNIKGELFVDIGANFGYHTFAARKNFKRIIAFEPHPININSLKQYAKYFSQIEAHQMAISNFNGTTTLFIANYSGGHTLQENKYEQKIPVQVTKLSDMLSNEVKIDLIKVDVEGVEWEVLDGAKEIMHKINAWIIELHNISRKKELDSLLRKFGYSSIWIDTNHTYARKIQ